MALVDTSYEIQDDQQEWLNRIVEEYDLPDSSKILCILLIMQ